MRCDQLVHQVLEGDEWHALHRLTYYSIPQTLLSYGNADFGIPVVLYYRVLSEVGLLNEFFMRLPMLLAGIGSIVLLPLLLRKRLPDGVLLIFALLLAVAPFLVYWSRMARTYSLTLFLAYLAFGLLALALRRPGLRRKFFPAYALLCGFTVWTHAITGPLLVTPLIALWIPTLLPRLSPVADYTLSPRKLFKLTVMTGVSMAAAVLPPLLGDSAALTGKAGVDSPNLDTLVGTTHLWLGTDSTLVVLIALLLAGMGLGKVWGACIEVRWILTGTILTLMALLLAQPWWVDRPLAFARYLLPVLPCLLLAIAVGTVRLGTMLQHTTSSRESLDGTFFLAVAMVSFWSHTAPLDEWLSRPNSYPTHMYFQYDYRSDSNPVRSTLPLLSSSPAWQELGKMAPPDSLLVAVAPFRYGTWEWPAPLWEQMSGQRVIPGFLWGPCETNLQGEVPDDGRFQLRNGVHLANDTALKERGVDWVAYYLSPQSPPYSPRLPHCETWMRQHFGPPDYEDEELLAWQLGQGGTP